jgi:hypothetical protein
MEPETPKTQVVTTVDKTTAAASLQKELGKREERSDLVARSLSFLV